MFKLWNWMRESQESGSRAGLEFGWLCSRGCGVGVIWRREFAGVVGEVENPSNAKDVENVESHDSVEVRVAKLVEKP
jgi:hypothetical protein